MSENNKPFERWLMSVIGASQNVSQNKNMLIPLGFYNGKTPNNSFTSLSSKNSYVAQPMSFHKVGAYPDNGTLSDTWGSEFTNQTKRIGDIPVSMEHELKQPNGGRAAARFFKDFLGNRSMQFTRNNPLDVVHETSHAVNDFGGVYDKRLDEQLAKYAEKSYGVRDPQEIINGFAGSEYDLPENKFVRNIRNIVSKANNFATKVPKVVGALATPLAIYSAKQGYDNAKKAGANPLIGMLSSIALTPTVQRLPSGELYNNQTGETSKDWL